MSKHQSIDQVKADAGKFVHESGLVFAPAMLPESMQGHDVGDAVKATENVLANMVNDDRAQKLGIKLKGLLIISKRHQAIEANYRANPTELVKSMERRLKAANCYPYVVYVHPSALNAFLVYVGADCLARAEQAMVQWIIDPSTPRGVSYSVKSIAK